jgi:hypothetical protein
LIESVFRLPRSLKLKQGSLNAQFGRLRYVCAPLAQTNQLLRRHRRTEGREGAALTQADASKLRSLVLGIVDDPRSVLIKLSDRLHNMRTLYALSPAKQVAFAQETLTVWCSLAARLGVFALKAELEDLCFAVLSPETFHALQSELKTLWCLKEDDERCASEFRPHPYSRRAAVARAAARARASIVSVSESVEGEGRRGDDGAAATTSQGDGGVLGTGGGGGGGVTYMGLSSVVQFERLTSRIVPGGGGDGQRELGVHPSAATALAMIQRCERELRVQLDTESCLTGLDYVVRGRLKSLYSVSAPASNL